MKTARQSGFTLLEMVLAIAILAVLSVMAYQVLQGTLRNEAITQQKSSQLLQLQHTFLLLERDLSQAVIADHAGFYAMPTQDAGTELSFTRANWANPTGILPRSQLEQVHYRLHNHTLERLSLPFQHQSSVPTKTQVLLKGVNAVQFRFYQQGYWQSEWSSTTTLPRGIEITLDIDGYGLVRKSVLLTSTEW